MAQGYYDEGMHEREAVFHLSFRTNPFGGHYTLCCGLQSVIDYLENWRFSQDDIDYLASLTDSKNQPLFRNTFLDYLKTVTFTGELYAIPEGTVVFPQEPLLRIHGPILQCQLLESPLLNLINFQTLIATKAARVCQAAGDDPVLEFGLRRAQGPNGALLASRAAFIGGCVATSNTLAGKLYDIPVRGTHAHSWVTAFDSELDAFRAFAKTMPDNCILLVDTYDTIQGVKNAITVGKELRDRGHDLLGIRLDSGDMVTLSNKARALLDEAGFNNTMIMASNSLDEHIIKHLKEKGAKINAWGVGTSLVTAKDDPALDGVYKLSALRNDQGKWQPKHKVSEDPAKTSLPGILQVSRCSSTTGDLEKDIIFNTLTSTKPDEPQYSHKLLLNLIKHDNQVADSHPSSLTNIKSTAKSEIDLLSNSINFREITVWPPEK